MLRRPMLAALALCALLALEGCGASSITGPVLTGEKPPVLGKHEPAGDPGQPVGDPGQPGGGRTDGFRDSDDRPL